MKILLTVMLLLISTNGYTYICKSTENYYEWNKQFKRVDKIEKTSIVKHFYKKEQAEEFAKKNNILLENILKDTGTYGGFNVVENLYATDYVCSAYEDTNY